MQSNLDIINITLPLSDSDIEKYFGHFNEYYFRIDYGNSLDNLKTNDKIYTYAVSEKLLFIIGSSACLERKNN